MHGDTNKGPLTGIKVLDLSAYLAGPYACTLLGDLGAQVIKIEPPTGDNLRNYPSTLPGNSRAFIGLNRNKLGLAIDLKKPGAIDVLHRLIADADVLVHNFRPSVPPRLGISYEQLAPKYPRLIYGSMTGYGESGPMKDNAGYDQVLQAMTGICAFQGRHGDRPEIAYGSIIDFYAASLLAYGVVSALYAREKTGRGQFVGESLLRSALAMQAQRMVWTAKEQKGVQRDMLSGGITGLHPTQDGYIYISANTPQFWKALCRLTGLEHLAEDPRFDSVKKRAKHDRELVAQLQKALNARTANEWEALFGDQVPCSAARRIEDMFDHPQVLAENMVSEYEHPQAGRLRAFSTPVVFSDTPCPAPFHAPAFGEHGLHILQQYGYSLQDIERLRVAGVIPQAAGGQS